MFYQDFNEQFEGYTQLYYGLDGLAGGCFIRISMNNLKDIHNGSHYRHIGRGLFYQDFNEQFEGYTQLKQPPALPQERCFIRISMNNLKDIHNIAVNNADKSTLFYQDFNEQFEGYTQLENVAFFNRFVVLSGFQ